MTHIRQLPLDELAETFPWLKSMEYTPNSMLTMGHWPELLGAVGGLAGVVLGSGEVDRGLKQLVAFVVSNASGCRYCQAHTSHGAVHEGVTLEKINAAFEFETSPLFNDAERAALRVALHAGMTPNAVDAEQMATLREQFTEKQVVEIVAVISLFGFFNRWNDTMATTLEDIPRSFAVDGISGRGWEVGKHA
jgi:AhpD family alkylhydroperoxidase